MNVIFKLALIAAAVLLVIAGIAYYGNGPASYFVDIVTIPLAIIIFLVGLAFRKPALG